MPNRYTGEMVIEVGGEVYPLLYDWRALALVQSEVSKEQQAMALNGDDIDSLAKLVAAGVEGLTYEDVLSASPPLMITIQAVDIALTAAYYGPNGPPEEIENPKRPQGMISSWLLRLLTGLVSRLQSSGS
ncbi:MAG: hypothetical protein HQL70_09645 [Magnetococcales bacterium]|nr:hypothetical protein [Magnetococcales bacterium]